MNLLLVYLTALALGSVHALEADHMAAVTVFSTRRPAPGAAAIFGLRWALGHGTVILVAGVMFLAAGIAIPETHWLDRLVGLVMVALGVWTVWHARHLHAHVHSHNGLPHAHLHSHALDTRHEHEHGPTMLGALHGLAGAAPVVALVQVARFDSISAGVGYLLIFALGTALGMAMYAFVAGLLLSRVAAHSERWLRALGQATGCGTVTVGLIWITR